MKKSQLKRPEKQHKYPISEMEAKYRIFKNPDAEKFEKIKEAIRQNGFYCLKKKHGLKDNICMCKIFLNKDEEGPCGCGLYYKEERTPSEIDKYMNTKLKWDEKKEKEIEKQLTKEEKENKKKQEKLEYEDD